jgi:hypothetical protein
MAFEYRAADGSVKEVTNAELKALAEAAHIDSETPVRKAGSQNWSKAGQVKGLAFGVVAEDELMPTLETTPEPKAETEPRDAVASAPPTKTQMAFQWRECAKDSVRFSELLKFLGNMCMAIAVLCIAVTWILAVVAFAQIDEKTLTAGSVVSTVANLGGIVVAAILLTIHGAILKGLSHVVNAVALFATDRADMGS